MSREIVSLTFTDHYARDFFLTGESECFHLRICLFDSGSVVNIFLTKTFFFVHITKQTAILKNGWRWEEINPSIFTETASNTLQNVTLFDFHVEPIYQVSSPYHFSWNGPILLKCWHLLSKTFLWHFNVSIVQQMFSYVDSQLRIDALDPLGLSDSYPCYGTSETTAVLSDHKWILHLRGIITKPKLVQK